MSVTVRELFDLGWWIAYCAHSGTPMDSVRDGKIHEDVIVELNNDFLRQQHNLPPMVFAIRVG